MSSFSPNNIIILPLGATEQHGPHLPKETDSLIANELAQRLSRAREEVQRLPTQTVGYSVEHLDYEGTLSLQFDQAVHTWLSMIKNQVDKGHRKFLLLNAHGGNSPLLTIVATEARIRYHCLVVATSWTRFGLPHPLSKELDSSIDIHAGAIETSMIMAIAPDLVDPSQCRNFPSKQLDYRAQFKHLRAYGPHAFGWKMQDLNQDGAVGNAQNASADKGEAILRHATNGLLELIDDMNNFDVDTLT